MRTQQQTVDETRFACHFSFACCNVVMPVVIGVGYYVVNGRDYVVDDSVNLS
jgi:hypothetical protein